MGKLKQSLPENIDVSPEGRFGLTNEDYLVAELLRTVAQLEKTPPSWGYRDEVKDAMMRLVRVWAEIK